MKEILEHFGFVVTSEDGYNWVMSDTKDNASVSSEPSPEAKEPLILPKRGKLLALDVMMDTLIKAKLDLHAYFSLKETVLGSAVEHASKSDIRDPKSIN
ncbi:MAG TPA: hypothetical protein VGG15_13095 [Terriglobales bacterium]|jgi:hypothetical protein